MAENDRFKDSYSGTPTIVSSGAVFDGKIISNQPVMVLGAVEGNCEISNLLTIEEGAKWMGKINADRVVLNGHLIGDVVVTEKLEIGQNAVLEGNVFAASLAIANGAVIKGEITMTSGQKPVHFEEKRKR